MKVWRSALLALALGAASIAGAQAHDSFSFGFNVGAPPVVFYNPPVVYYSALPRYYRSASVVTYRNDDDRFRGCRRGERHEEREHHGWRHEEREHGGWNRNGRGRDHDDD